MIRLRAFEKMSYNEIRMEYLKQLVAYKVVEFDEEDILDNGPSKRNGKSKTSYKILTDFPALREYLYNDNEEIKRDNLRQILIGPDEAPRSLGGRGEFATMRNVFDKIILDIEGCNSNVLKTAVSVCEKIFKYKQLNIIENGFSEPLAYWLQRQLGVKVCPYCNRMYTTTLYGKKRIRPDFDHFYPQSIYPYLAVSLFNLIPSCSICNKAKSDNAEIKKDIEKETKGSNFKHKQKSSIIYPYDESYNELQMRISFRIIPYETQKEVIMGQSDKFWIEFRPTAHSKNLEFEDLAPTKTELDERFRCKINSEISSDEKIAAQAESEFWDRAKHTINLLRLESLYNEHKLEIMNILRIHYEYNQIARKLIVKPLNDSNVATYLDFTSFTDLLYFAFLKQEEWGNSPLNKLKSDILEQLNELENTRKKWSEG